MSGRVNAKTMRATLGVASALGLDAGALAETWGVAEALTNVDARFPHSTWLQIWQEIIQQTGCESAGLTAAERLPWGHWDVIDYLIGSSANLEGALRRIERYFALISSGVTHTLEDHGDTVHLVRRYAPGCQTRLLAPAEFAFAAILAHTRLAVGVRWCPREVRFAAPAPSSDMAHRKMFGCPVLFDATTSRMVIERSTLALPMQRTDPDLVRILEKHADQLVGQLGIGAESDVVSQVRRIIVDGLPDGEISLSHTARQLGMSVRTLQRRLRETSLTFDDVFDAARKELARTYLNDRAVSIQETAHLLAYRDLRGFYRAFRRWEGCTPAAYRRRLRKTGPKEG